MTPERVRFSSHRFPFYVEITICSRRECECGELTFHLEEGADGEELPPSPMNLRIRVDPETWREVEAPPRQPAAEAIVREFLRDYPPHQRDAHQTAARRAKEIARRLKEYRINPRDIESGRLIPWGEIVSNRTATSLDVSSVFDAFTHDGVSYLVDDSYCANPDCHCREVHLLFMAYHASDTPAVRPRADDRFIAIWPLDGELEIARCLQGTADEAKAIATAWRAGYGEDRGELEWRYGKVKEIARRTHRPSPTVTTRPQLHPVPVSATVRPGRNDPCPCGSGRKYKKCCGG